MNFKTKTLALVAGTAFALSSALGVSAQDGSTEAVLANDPFGTCSISLSGDREFNFGTYTWDADVQRFVTDGENDATLNATVIQTVSNQNVKCNGELRSSLIAPIGGEGSNIPRGLVQVEFGDGLSGDSVPLGPDNPTFSGDVPRSAAGLPGNITMTLQDSLGNQYVPDTYNSTLTITMTREDQEL